MSEKEKKLLEKIKNVLPSLSQEKQEYLIGVADGIALASSHQDKKKADTA